MDRREFLRAGLGLAGSASAFAPLFGGRAAARGRQVSLVADPSDPIATAAPAQWALGEVQRTLADVGFTVRRIDRVQQADAGDLCIVVAGAQSPVAAAALTHAKVSIGDGAERLALLTTSVSGRDALLACGTDPRGLTYALLELADRVRLGAASAAGAPPHGDAASALAATTPVVERPANPVRCIMRQFTSEPLDTAWFNDREMWPRYLTMLATHRFNRLHLGFGLGYDTLQQVTDSYLLFLYPFLIGVPGYDVRATNLSDAERDRNLDTLRFISDQTVARGMTFQLGVWMHGYALINSPKARYIVEGLTPATHAPYCRDALTAVLRACPAISAVALRIHGESGVAEGSYDFWTTIFDGVKRCGRTVEIDLHAKGLDQAMIDRALATGMPVNVSPKYWAEHLGMPYHQAAIRELEMPVAGQTGRGLMTLSEGQRSFTRYGYADLLRDDRQYTVRHRIFAGTQRLLLSGDGASTAAYGRMFSFCGSTGVDIMEPLTCRGRRGTGIANARRSGYADEHLDTRWDWEKFEYWYRVWGRLTYNPDADAAQWRRHFSADPHGAAIASALARASRILPIVTTAHLPSAACDAYWPEVYWNQPMAGEPRPNPYGDTRTPKTFQHVSPLDPQLFSSIDEHAAELLAHEPSGKYSPIDVAVWLDELAAGIAKDLAPLARAAASPAARRATIDAQIQADLGRFFAAKFRAGVLYAIHERTGDRHALDEAVRHYRAARASWAALCERARPVYAADLSVSDRFSERGQWTDRLAAIDDDIERIAQRAPSPSPTATIDTRRVQEAIAAATSHPRRAAAPCTHTPPAGFKPGTALPLELTITGGRHVTSAWCYYRHVNQAERFQRVAMDADARAGAAAVYRASVPVAYTDSPFPLQYYFAIRETGAAAHLHPGLGADLLNQPYFVLRRI
jgi:hypothetical protein